MDRADRVVFDGEYLCVVACDGPGIRQLRLPVKASRLVDFASGRSFKARKEVFQVDMKPGDVKLFRAVK